MSKILIVDDEKQIRRILSVVLIEHRYQVADAETGEEAIAMLEDFAPDILLLDLNLPGIDGIETMRQALARMPTVDIIIMTAFGTIRSAVEAMRGGAFDYLTKPFDNDEVLMLVERALKLRRLTIEVGELREELEARYGFNEIIGISPPMQEVFRTMAKVARVDATVLITGESGTGKELVARALHRRSKRSEQPFVPVNCSAIPRNLVESEFFGYEKGAFTDARERRPGKFEQASGGTLFLDEIGDLALDAQAKLLRALQERRVTRLGSQKSTPVDVRVVAATNKDLDLEVSEGRFREDLFWRLNVVHILLPALRERGDDLPLLCDDFLDRFNRELGLAIHAISPQARKLLYDYHWPGNIRELENTICRSMILCEEAEVKPIDLPGRIRGELPTRRPAGLPDLDEMPLADAVRETAEALEKRMILSRLAAHNNNRTATAESLGISRKTLFNKMRQFDLGDDNDEAFSR